MTKNAGRVANDLAMGTVYEFVTKMLVALQMTLPWVQSYAFGRFANDLAMGTGIRIRNREMLVAVQMTQLWYKQTNSWRKCGSRFN